MYVLIWMFYWTVFVIQARQTVEKYDMATESLQNTVKETGELEKRANQAGVELIKASDTLRAIRAEVKDMERKQAKQERLLRDINQVNMTKVTAYYTIRRIENQEL